MSEKKLDTITVKSGNNSTVILLIEINSIKKQIKISPGVNEVNKKLWKEVLKYYNIDRLTKMRIKGE